MKWRQPFKSLGNTCINYFVAVGVLVPLFFVHFVVLGVHLNLVHLHCMLIISTLSDSKLMTNIFSWLSSFSE